MEYKVETLSWPVAEGDSGLQDYLNRHSKAGWEWVGISDREILTLKSGMHVRRQVILQRPVQCAVNTNTVGRVLNG